MPDDRPLLDDEPAEGVFEFREQADGRKVARLPGGKVVLINFDDIGRIRDGERWRVRLQHRDTYAIASPVERERPLLTNPVLGSTPLAGLLKSRPASPPAPVPAPAPVVSQPGPPAPSAPVATPARTTDRRPEERTPAIQPSRVVGMNDRVAMFIDGANMDGACRLAGYFLDYRKAQRFFLAHGLFYAAYYYIADYTAQDPLQQRYLDFLAQSNYIVRRKAVKAIRDKETGERVLKANVDTELVLDLINTADNYDLAFLFSGDSDFERAVDLLRSRGKRVYLVTARPTLSRELSYVADKPIFFIEDFRQALERDQRTTEAP
jgi:uncharacterized LabA/DUF88 family protein